MGVLSGAAVGHEELWELLVTPRDAVEPRLVGFSPTDWMPKKVARRADRAAQLALAAASLAHEDAGSPDVDPDRTAVITGSWISPLESTWDALRQFALEGAAGMPTTSISRMMANAPAALVSMALGVTGPAWSVSSGCATGTQVLLEGARLIRSGEVDVVYAGSSEARVPATPDGTDPVHAGLMNIRVHSSEVQPRPFDAERAGLVLAEGAAFLRLEAASAARSRGATSWGEVAGGGLVTEGFDLVAPHPDGVGVRMAMAAALDRSRLVTGQVGQINAHGSGTQAGDRAEATAIRSLFGDHSPLVTSTKGATGHALAAAGTLEAVAVVLSIAHALVPPTMGCRTVDPTLGVDVVTGGPRPWEPGPALSNSIGLGSHNASVVILPPTESPRVR